MGAVFDEKGFLRSIAAPEKHDQFSFPSNGGRRALRRSWSPRRRLQTSEKLEGYLAYDDNAKGQRPGVLVIPEWWRLND